MAIIKNKLRSPKVANPQTDDDYDIYHPETEISQVVGGVAKVNGLTPDANQNIDVVKTVNNQNGDVTVTLTPDYPLKALADGFTRDLIIIGKGTANSKANNGINASIGAGGALVVGAGESASASELIMANDENLYLLADGNVCVYPNCDTYANHKEFKFTTDGKLVFPNGEIWFS